MTARDDEFSERQCWELLATASVGRLALSLRALPVILPVQYYLDGRRLAVCLGHHGLPEQSLVVPDVAVGSDQGYKYVYVVNAGNIAKKRDITTGRAHGPLRVVLTGLTPDDRVIVNGLMMLRPDAKVVVDTPESKAQSEQAAAQTDKPQANSKP